MNPFEQVRGGDVAEVEWRVLPHQDYIDILTEIENREVAAQEVIAGNRLHVDRVRSGIQPAAVVGQVLGEIMVKLMAQLLRFEHDRESGIARNVDPLEGVHLNGDAQAHFQTALVRRTIAVTLATHRRGAWAICRAQ